MDSDVSWDDQVIENCAPISPIDNNEDQGKETNNDQGKAVCLNIILPDDILDKIMSFLPVSSLICSGSVCQKWYAATRFGRHIWKNMPPQKPWYFMIRPCYSVSGCVYDLSIQKWFRFDIPGVDNRNLLFSSSHGLVCFMDNNQSSCISVCNPLKGYIRHLQDAPSGDSIGYRDSFIDKTLAMSVNKGSQNYTVVVVRSRPLFEVFPLPHWGLMIHMYESETKSWISPFNGILHGWRGGTESVICNGVLYCLICSCEMMVVPDAYYGLLIYDISARFSSVSEHNIVPIPYSLTCVRLMNVQEKLIMVGGIAQRNPMDIINGIGIWELKKQEWHMVARMPRKFIQRLGGLDEDFASSGGDDLIYIRCYGSTNLLVFDMRLKVWKWAEKWKWNYRVAKKSPRQLCDGFCFEPRLEVAP